MPVDPTFERVVVLLPPSRLLRTFRRVVPTVLSLFIASAAVESRNLAERVCRALWTDSSLMLARSPLICCRRETASESTACSAAKTEDRAIAERHRAWKKPAHSMVARYVSALEGGSIVRCLEAWRGR